MSIPCLEGGAGNTCYGTRALSSSTNSAENNTAIGYESLMANTVGDNNTGIGYQTLWNNKTGNKNTALGGVA